jgi:hypothetical protein
VEFQAIHDRSPLARYPHITSNLAALCKYNILKAQFIRFTRIITERAVFATELAHVIVELARRGYRFSWLWKDVDTLLSRHARRVFAVTPAALAIECLDCVVAGARAAGGVYGLDAWAADLARRRRARG